MKLLRKHASSFDVEIQQEEVNRSTLLRAMVIPLRKRKQQTAQITF